jgi:tetratricopeptide (TPR) repeat protein
MVEELTVLLVGDDEPDEKLVQQLEKKNLNVEISAQKELGSLLALVEPHIVVHIGKNGAEATVNLLKQTEEVRRVRLIILAERDALSDLRNLDRTVVVSLLADDIAPSVVAARVLMLAKKGPEKSLRPPSAAATLPAAKVPAAKLPPKAAPTAPEARVEAPRFGLASAVTVPPKVSPPRAESMKAKPAPRPIVSPVAPEKPPLAAPSPTRAAKPPAKSADTPRPDSDFPTMSIDIALPEAALPEAARPDGGEARLILADDDMTRADLIACALRAANVATRIVPLDPAKTHWPLVREFAPTLVMADNEALRTAGQMWLQLFQADHALRKAKLISVPFDQLWRVGDKAAELRTLLPHIPELSRQLDLLEHPTSAPFLPKEPRSAPIHSSPMVEAPVPFADDDPDEFERLTVARPIDAPLPTEATRSRLPDLPVPLPAAGTPPSPSPRAEGPSSAGAGPAAPRPVFDSLAPAPAPEGVSAPKSPVLRAAVAGGLDPDTPKTPAATETRAPVEKGKSGGGGGKFALAAILLLVLGGAGGWFAFGKKLPGYLRLAPPAAVSTRPPAEKSAPAPTIPEIPEAPPPDENAPTPEQLLWRVQSSPAPTCDALVNNLDELKVGGVQQAAVSLAKARQQMVLGRLDDALTLLCEAVLVHPESLALEELAALYLSKGSPEQALEWYQKAASLRADRPRTLELGGDIHSQLGNVAEAKAAFIASLKVKADDEKTLKAVSKQFVEQGSAEFKAGAFDAATLLYRRAATLDLESAEAYAGLAATSAAVGNAQAAGRFAERTLALDDGHHVALVVQAALATEAGDLERAKILTEKAIERNQNYLPAHELRQKLKGE